MFNRIYLILLSLLIVPAFLFADYFVASQVILHEAIKDVKPGEKIVIKDGIYTDWHVNFDCKGSANKVINIIPETPGRVIFKSSMINASGEYLVFDGFRFSGNQEAMVLNNSTQCRVTGCVFDENQQSVIRIAGKSINNRIDHCLFKDNPCKNITIRIGDSDHPVSTRIDNNVFMDIPPLGGNGRETIQIGQNQSNFGHLQAKTIIKHNLFLRCNGESEIISNQSSGNLYLNNYFKDCEGELVMRGGFDCTIDGNWFERCTGGIRLSGQRHIVMNNVIINSSNTGIRLFYGMAATPPAFYLGVSDCVVENNTIINAGQYGLLIGDQRNRDLSQSNSKIKADPERYGPFTVHTVAPFNNIFRKNIIAGEKGILMYHDHAPDNRVEYNVLSNTGTARIEFTGDNDVVMGPIPVDYQNTGIAGFDNELKIDGVTKSVWMGAKGNFPLSAKILLTYAGKINSDQFVWPAKTIDSLCTEKQYQTLLKLDRKQVFFDSGHDDWCINWDLDGQKASILNDTSGMRFTAGPVWKNDSSHAVLWSKKSFDGDLFIEYDYTRTDSVYRGVTILYIQATGSDSGRFVEDISQWADLRTVPSMRTYFNHMNLLHISYASYGSNWDNSGYNYIRARRYMPETGRGMQNTALVPDYFNKDMFKPGLKNHITIIKRGRDLFMYITNSERQQLCHWENDVLPPVTHGRIGLRHMNTRSARYENFSIYKFTD